MQTVSAKRQARIERKKQKLLALAAVAKLNDMDNQMTNSEESPEPNPKRFCGPQAERKMEELQSKEHLSEDQLKELRHILNERRKLQRTKPKFYLREHGELAQLSVDVEMRLPVFLTDIQHLIMQSQMGGQALYSTARWCQLEKLTHLKQTNVFIIENISLNHYETHVSCFPFLTSHFANKLEMLAPKFFTGDSIQELATVSITNTQMKKYLRAHGEMEKAAERCPELFNFTKNVFPVTQPIKQHGTAAGHAAADKFPRTELLLSGWQMVEENFPLPIKGICDRKYKGYVLTKDSYAEVTPNSPMFGLDCEMCKTTTGDLELTRVSIVDENYKLIYNELVKPDNRITDYLTPFSGINAKMMVSVTKKLKDVQTDIRRLLPSDAIIVGQSVNNDFHALKMMHPYVIDTSIIYNLTGNRTRKSKLKTLTLEFLSERIQEDKSGHCSTEDSIASLKLTKLKLSKDIYFGDAVMTNIDRQVRHYDDTGSIHYATSMLRQITSKDKKKAYVIAAKELAMKYAYFTFKKETLNDKKGVIIKRGETNDDVVQKMAAKTNANLLIGHIKLTDHEINLSKDTFAKVNNWIKQIYESSLAPSLNIVVFCGGKEAGNGCCFIDIKQLSN